MEGPTLVPQPLPLLESPLSTEHVSADLLPRQCWLACPHLWPRVPYSLLVSSSHPWESFLLSWPHAQEQNLPAAGDSPLLRGRPQTQRRASDSKPTGYLLHPGSKSVLYTFTSMFGFHGFLLQECPSTTFATEHASARSSRSSSSGPEYLRAIFPGHRRWKERSSFLTPRCVDF